jgi:uncharacterized membrane protein
MKSVGFNIQFLNQRIHFLFSYFCPIHPTHVSAVTLPSSRYTDKFTSLFTGPFGIITTVTLFKATIYIDNHNTAETCVVWTEQNTKIKKRIRWLKQLKNPPQHKATHRRRRGCLFFMPTEVQRR